MIITSAPDRLKTRVLNCTFPSRWGGTLNGVHVLPLIWIYSGYTLVPLKCSKVNKRTVIPFYFKSKALHVGQHDIPLCKRYGTNGTKCVRLMVLSQ